MITHEVLQCSTFRIKTIIVIILFITNSISNYFDAVFYFVLQPDFCTMIIDCCAQQRSYEKFFGLLAQVSDGRYMKGAENLLKFSIGLQI